MKTHYSSPIAHKLIAWAKAENSHQKALRLVGVADLVEERWLMYADGDVARWRSTRLEDIKEATK